MSRIKRRNYTFALTKDNDRIIRIVKRYPKYAFICHDKDEGETHYHYYIEFPNPRSLDSVASELKIPSNMIEQVYNKKGILQYLTHQNESNKFHYDISEVESNFDLSEESVIDIEQEMADYESVCEGKMTWQDFIMKYKSYCATLSIRNRVSMYKQMREVQGTEGLSPFRVPCSKNRGN